MDYRHLFDLTGKVALVTGSSKGIGKAIAEAMAASGAKVVISSRKAERCQKVAADIEENGGEAIAVPCNISDPADLENLVEQTRGIWGRIDVLVCNAAVNPYFGPLAKVTDEAYDKVMGTNVKNNLRLCNLVIPEMAERRDGAVIILSSIAGLRGQHNIALYGLSKAADMQLCRDLAVEWGRSNVRVNCIAPGIVRTDFSRVLWEDEETYRDAVQYYPLGRLGEPEEIAGAAVFLASAAGSFMTGQTMVIDGGYMVLGGSYA